MTDNNFEKHPHEISREAAIELTTNFKEFLPTLQKAGVDFAEGFFFDAVQVRQLLNHSEAEWFFVQPGVKKLEEKGADEAPSVNLVLYITDKDFKVIHKSERLSTTTLDTDTADFAEQQQAATSFRVLSNTTIGDEKAGGFLDEGSKMPPPHVDF